MRMSFFFNLRQIEAEAEAAARALEEQESPKYAGLVRSTFVPALCPCLIVNNYLFVKSFDFHILRFLSTCKHMHVWAKSITTTNTEITALYTTLPFLLNSNAI